MSDQALLINYELCTGCHSCEVACKEEHDIPLGKWGIKVAEDGPWKIEDENWHWDYVPIPTELCDMCEARLAEGKQPMCVQSCQPKVMEFGTAAELAARMDEIGHRCVIFKP